jgi:hypothetical protein
VLPARVASRLDRAQQALLQILDRIRREGRLHGIEPVRAREVVAEDDEVAADAVPGPKV